MCIVPRGMLKSHIIMFLKETPMHGYGIIKRMERCTGFWKPSPGAIYPMLSHMEAAGIIKSRKRGKRVVYSLTALGQRMAKNVERIKDDFREKRMEMISSAIKSGDFAKMNERLVRKLFQEKPSFNAVKSANDVWIKTLNHFYSNDDACDPKVEELLNDTATRLGKMLKGKG